jgi:6-phosphogluconate dehydrogenase
MADGHNCVVFDLNAAAVTSLVEDGAVGAASFEDAVAKLGEGPRAVWLMLPSGQVTENAVNAFGKLLGKGDVLIDGGNSYYKDTVRRAHALTESGIHYVDCGTSGGIWGLERGYCLMIGGDAEAVGWLDPIFRTLAPGLGSIEATSSRKPGASTAELGYLHTGPTGSGHFVKMIHNGIEYGLMQAYAEGFDILRNKNSTDLEEDDRFSLDVADIAELWRRGSVVSSWLLDLAADALGRDPALSGFVGSVPDSGEGRWTVQAAIDEAVPAEVLTVALYARFRSRREHTFAEKLLSAMRFGFGGHKETITPAPVPTVGTE